MRALVDGNRAFDRYQQQHAWLGFPLAVRQKYADDQGGYLAATISYYGFFSVFPLLLVLATLLGLTTLLGFVLGAHHHLYQRVVIPIEVLARTPLAGGIRERDADG
jgi:membrane protein